MRWCSNSLSNIPNVDKHSESLVYTAKQVGGSHSPIFQWFPIVLTQFISSEHPNTKQNLNDNQEPKRSVTNSGYGVNHFFTPIRLAERH